MNRISTHVLDTSQGKPAKDVPVKLERQNKTGEWTPVSSARTDADGRCVQLLPETATLTPSIYRLTFDTAVYYAAQSVASLHPQVEITFQVREGESHFHLPLLLSPHGYTTYRGS